MSSEILDRIEQTIRARLKADPQSSYVARLQADGLDKILKKIAEESGEVLIAAKNGNSEALIHEIADLWFHCLVLLGNQDLSWNDIAKELERREGVSGLNEKASRENNG